jgi:hypothetical protein
MKLRAINSQMNMPGVLEDLVVKRVIKRTAQKGYRLLDAKAAG